MKNIVILILSSFLLFSCIKKNDLNEVEQETFEYPRENIIISEDMSVHTVQELENHHVFDIDSFKYLEEFPSTIAGIKAMYPEELFEEKVINNDMKGFIGSYWYLLSSPNIRFSFLGDTTEDAYLRIVVITNIDYQCESIQVIGMNTIELEKISGKKLTLDNNINIYTELYVLVIVTENGFVNSYRILAEL